MKNVFFLFIILFLVGISHSSSTDTIELIFSHQLHMVEAELECSTCHESALNSVSGKDNLFPDMETCGDCHEIEEDENCGMCHSDVDDPREVPRIEIYMQKFSHKKHLESGFDCQNCHAPVAQKKSVGTYILTNMISCIDCHDEKAAPRECSVCHLPEESLIPVSHNLDFMHNHSDLATNEDPSILNDKKCSTCHSINFCQECHAGDNLERTTHALNYQFTHSLDAQAKGFECSTCHTDRLFCIECHRDNQIMPHNHSPGWVNQIPDDGGRHKLEAEIDLESCMACHEQNAEQICQPCHGI